MILVLTIAAVSVGLGVGIYCGTAGHCGDWTTSPITIITTTPTTSPPTSITINPTTPPTIDPSILVACAFFNTPNLLECQTTTSFRNGTTGTTIPTEIGLLTQLISLDLSGTSWTGYIPSTLGYLTRLQYLRLDHNQRLFGTILSTLGNLQQLTALHMNNNTSLVGTIPFTFGNLTQLTVLDVPGNQLTGRIP